MRLEATLSRNDLVSLFERFAPLTIRLGEQGELTLEEPHDVTLDGKAGVRVACKAKLLWSVLGIHVPVTVHSLAARVTPVVERDEHGADALVFKLAIDSADFASLPHALDVRVTARVNEELQKKHLALSWNYRDLLDRVFPLPERLESAALLQMRVTDATIHTTGEALTFAVGLEVSIQLRQAAAAVSAAAQ